MKKITVWYQNFEKGLHKFTELSQEQRDKGATVDKYAFKLSTGEMYNLFDNGVLIQMTRATLAHAHGYRTDISYIDRDISMEDIECIRCCHIHSTDRIVFY